MYAIRSYYASFSFTLPLGKNHFKENDFKSYETEASDLKPITHIEYEELEDSNEKNNLPKLLIVEDNPELLDSLAHERNNFV